MGDVPLVARQQLHRLPDAAERAVPALLAMRDFAERKVRIGLGVAAGQRHMYFQRALGRGALGDDELEGQVAAFMGAEHAAIEADFGEVVHGAKADGDFAALPGGRDRQLAGVDSLAGRMAQVGEFSLPGAGDGGIAPVPMAIEPEAPRAVERDFLACVCASLGGRSLADHVVLP